MDIRNRLVNIWDQSVRITICNQRAGVCNHRVGVCYRRASVRNDRIGIDCQFGLEDGR